MYISGNQAGNISGYGRGDWFRDGSTEDRFNLYSTPPVVRQMYLKADTLDDLLREVFQNVLTSKVNIKPTRGKARDLTGVLLELTNPRARLSRTETRGMIFSSLGELLWYLAKTNDLDFIVYYLRRYIDDSEDGQSIYGGYGPRLFSMRGELDQVSNVQAILSENRDSRRAVIQLFDAADISQKVPKRREIPCTCTLQFMIRNDRLDMLTNMRSNDAFLGLSHDVFAFTMLQEILARSLFVSLGTYKHCVGSLHLYEKHFKHAENFLEEGYQTTTVSMPTMPAGDPWPSISLLVEAESLIRSGAIKPETTGQMESYWQDLVRLLEIFAASKKNDEGEISRLKAQMVSDCYRPFIEKKQLAKKMTADNSGRSSDAGLN